LVEASSLSDAIGEWTLRAACRDATQWPDSVRVSVPLTAGQFRSRGLLSMINSVLQESGLAASRLQLGLTEAAVMEGSEAALATVQQLRQRGIAIALEGYGSGYCSLSFMMRCPIDRIGIDRALIQDIGQRPNCIAFLRAVLGLCSGLGIGSSAQGIETQEELALLIAEGCQGGQGPLFGEPQPASNLALWLEAPPLRQTG
jgi:EAL domain-containing protein (putative c-di-GMP-specific phosphodiesterase class I)